MALSQSQNFKDHTKETVIYTAATRFVNIKTRLITVRNELLATTAAVDADPNANAELKTLATQAENFANNANITDFIDFITNQLG